MEYKDTSIGIVPVDWKLLELKDIGKFQYGYTTSAEDHETGVKFLRITDIVDDGTISWKKVPYCSINQKDFKKYELMPGDIVFARIGATSGKTGFIEKNGLKSIFASYLIRLKVKEGISPKLIFYLTHSNIYWSQVIKQREGQLKKGMNAKMLSLIQIPVPEDISEQEKIAEILSTVDQAIQKSDEIIAKTERLKKSMIYKLLDEGIEHDEFKDTPRGRIPINWNIERLGDITQVTVGHVGPISQYYTDSDEGIPLVSTTNISDNGMDLKNLKFVSKEFDEKYKKSKVFSNDLIIARHGASGSASLVPPNLDKAQSLNVVIVRASKNFNSKYLEFLFNYGTIKTRLAGWKSGSVQGVVNTRVLEKFKIPIPSLTEQGKIVSIASSIDEKYKVELIRNLKLKNIKKGLMNDLLTGRKRVKINN